MKWILVLTCLASNAWALNPAEQNLINEYLLPKKQQATANNKSPLSERLSKLKDEVETLSLQAIVLTSRMKEMDSLFQKKSADFARGSKYNSLYRNPKIRAKMIDLLSHFCCEMAKNPAEYAKATKKVKYRSEIEEDKYKEEQKKKEKTPARR